MRLLFAPIGIWRSLRYHRETEARKTMKKVEKMLDER
jgi:hypothetical protein